MRSAELRSLSLPENPNRNLTHNHNLMGANRLRLRLGLGLSRAAALLACMVLLLGFSGCGGRERVTRADAARAEGILLRGNGQDPDSLDPHLATLVSAGNVLFNVFEGLVRFHEKTLEPEPAIAEAWEISEDGLEWVFHLREAQWSNGDPVRAEDFVFAWRRMLHPDLAAAYAYMLFPLENAREVNAGDLPPESLGVTADDSRTLRVRLHRPVPYFLSLLAHWTWFPLHEASLTALGAETDRTVLWTRPETMVVNGPFRLKSWRPERELVLERNEHYWEADRVRLNGAVFLPHGDPTTEERAFRSGALHITYTLPRQRLNHHRESDSGVLRMDPNLESVGWVVNVRLPDLDRVELRRALSLSLDRTAIAERVLGGIRQPAFSHVPPGTGGHEPEVLLHEDLEEAKALLRELGFSEENPVRELEMILPNRADWVRVAEVMREQWARVGIPVVINSMERSTYFARRREGAFDLCFLGWVGDYPDPTTFLSLWLSDAGNNLSGWASEEYDALLDASARDLAQRPQLLRDAEAIVLQELPVIPLVFGTSLYLIDPAVQGWYPNLLNHHPLRAVGFEP
jgi:oligopeptide transport system substrate-binding protein